MARHRAIITKEPFRGCRDTCKLLIHGGNPGQSRQESTVRDYGEDAYPSWMCS